MTETEAPKRRRIAQKVRKPRVKRPFDDRANPCPNCGGMDSVSNGYTSARSVVRRCRRCQLSWTIKPLNPPGGSAGVCPHCGSTHTKLNPAAGVARGLCKTCRKSWNITKAVKAAERIREYQAPPEPPQAPVKLFEVRVYEPALNRSKKRGKGTLEDDSHHPARWRYVNCRLQTPKKKMPEATWLSKVKEQGKFPFVDGVCQNFLGFYWAEIVGEIPPDRYEEADRFAAAPEPPAGIDP